MRGPTGKTCQALTLLTVCVATATLGEEVQLVLDETAYWRSHLTCRPVRVEAKRLQANAAGILSETLLRRIRKRVTDELAAAGRAGQGATDKYQRMTPGPLPSICRR